MGRIWISATWKLQYWNLSIKMQILLWKRCVIFQLGFKYFLAKESGLAGESTALLAPKPLQCREGRTVMQLFSSYVRINHWLTWLFFSIELLRQLIHTGQPKVCMLLHLPFIGPTEHASTGQTSQHPGFLSATTSVSNTRNKHLPFLHGWKLYPAVKSGIISTDKIRTVFSCKRYNT